MGIGEKRRDGNRGGERSRLSRVKNGYDKNEEEEEEEMLWKGGDDWSSCDMEAAERI